MSRPDVACLCINLGVHAALTVTGEHRDQLIEQFIADHSGPGHIPVNPSRDWHGREAEFQRYLARVRRQMVELTLTEDAPQSDWRQVENVKVKDEAL